MKIADGVGAAHSHRHPQGAHQILRAVGNIGRPVQQLPQSAFGANIDARAARQLRVCVGHPPIVASARRFGGLGKGRAQHHGVGAAGHRLAQVAAGADAAVGNDAHIAAGALVIILPGGGAFQRRRNLRYAHSGNLTGRAGGAGADAHQHGVNPSFHQLAGHGVTDAVAHHHRNLQRANQLGENQTPVAAGNMPRRGNGGLHYHDVGAGFYRQRAEPLGSLRRKGDGGYRARLLDFPHPLANQVVLHRLAVHLLQVLRYLRLLHRDDFLQDGVGVGVARIEALAVQHAEAAHFVHQGGEPGRNRAVHRRGQHRRLKSELADAQLRRGQFGIDGHRSGNDGDFIESVRPFQFFQQSSGHQCHLKRRRNGWQESSKYAAG